MPEAEIWSLSTSVGLFFAAALLISVFGAIMTALADRLADVTGLGEAVTGAMLLGGATSLPEIATSLTAAVEDHPALAVSNAIGSIAAQTAFLAIADMTYRKVNLEHAAASAENLMLGAFLVALLAIPLLAIAVPQATILGIHPATLMLFAVYAYGMWLVSQTHRAPMWYPRRTRETRVERVQPSRGKRGPWAGLWLRFVLCAAIVSFSGWMLARAGVALSTHTGLSETMVGGALTGAASSLPELITAVTAVRLGALTLAVANVLGGNAFDTLIVAFSDLAYRGGSIYAGLLNREVFLIALTILLTSVLLMGMLHREKHGIANIGLESFLVLVLYVGAFVVLGLAT
jgi:cation:H+ antiporter